MRPWCPFAISSYCCFLIRKTKIHPDTWQNFLIYSRLQHFCFSFLPPIVWKTWGFTELYSLTSQFVNKRAAFLPFPIQSWKSRLHPCCLCDLLLFPSRTTNFFNKTYCIYLTFSYKKPKACKKTGFSVMNFHPKDTQMEIITLWKLQSLGFRINQIEQNILRHFHKKNWWYF